MVYSVIRAIGVFCLLLAFVTFWLPTPYWTVSILFLVISFLSVALSMTWDVAEFGQKQVDKLDVDN